MPQYDAQWRYKHSAKGKATAKRYRASFDSALTRQRFYAKHGGQAAYERQWYHDMQDRIGCHGAVVLFYPAYRLLKSFETAEVVEI